MKKRLLALLLVLTMVFSLMPAALAADTVDVAALPEYTAGADTSTGAAYKISTEESLRAFAASGGRGNEGAKPRESVTVKPPDGG